MTEYSVVIDRVSTNPHVDLYDGTLTLLVVEADRRLHVPFRTESNGGLLRETEKNGPIWRWVNPDDPVDDLTLEASIGWDFDRDGDVEIHGYVRNGAWVDA